MSNPAISVRGVGKLYRIGAHKERYRTFREALTKAVKAPFRRLTAAGRSERDSETALWALKDVSFDVQPGEVVGVIGRNGAGKSTLLKILTQITAPTEGEIEIRGRVASLLEVGTGFHPELSGRDNIFLNGAILGMRRAEIESKFDEIVAFAEVDKFIDTPVKRYSSGMYVRLAFAVAAHLEPEILLVDEVLAVGDIQFQKKCLGKMGDVAKSGRTVLFVSHNMPAVEKLCSRCILLSEGRLLSEGETREVIGSYMRAGEARHYEWCRGTDRPGQAQICRVALVNREGEPVRGVTTASEIAVEIECYLPKAIADLRMGVAVFGGLEQAIFSTHPVDDGQPYPTAAGRHWYRVELPRALFMAQRYSVTVTLYTRLQPVDTCPHVIVFDVDPVASLSTQSGINRFGLIQLPCKWEHEVRVL